MRGMGTCDIIFCPAFLQVIFVMMIEWKPVKVNKDLERTAKQVEEYGVYCHEEQRERGFSIKAAQKEIDQNTALAESAAAKMSNAADDLQSAAARGAEAEGELKSATAQHEETMKEHAAAEAELKEAVDMISRAISVLKREMVSWGVHDLFPKLVP